MQVWNLRTKKKKKIDEVLPFVENKIKNLKAEFKTIEDGLLNADEVSAKSMELEDRFHRNNLRVALHKS